MPDSKELIKEFKSVVSGSNSFLDSIIPPLLFLIINAILGFQPALWSYLAIGVFISLLRLLHKQKAIFALGGLGAALVAIGLRYFLNSSQAYFLPTVFNDGLIMLALLISTVIKRPAVAFTSALTRRWPLEWYWHEKVRPAYSDVTIIWVVYYGLKLVIQYMLFRQGNIYMLAIFNFFGGWPALILLLIVSYTYGQNRFRKLKGLSVQEFLQKNTTTLAKPAA